MTARVYGIDLGTTYSCIAYVDENSKPVVVPNSENQLTTPSVVYFENPENIVVGAAAKGVAEFHTDAVVSTVKRVMGDPNWTTEHHGKTYHPQDVSSFILRKLIKDAERHTNDKIGDAVITCPAYFGVTQREATRQAGVLAGLNVHYVIPEPTAAAIAHSIDESQDQTVLVFDLGGGTFDVTVLSVRAGAIEVECTGGDHVLGGKNWDEKIALWFAEQFSEKTGVSADELTDDPETWQELLKASEAAKIALSHTKGFPHRVQYHTNRVLVELTRETFDELTSSLLERTLTLTEDLLKTARDKGVGEIDKMLLVGGSTFMPQVKTALAGRFPFEISWFEPNEAVAKGAALMGFKCQLDEKFAEWVKKEIAQEKGKDVADVTEEEVAKASENNELRVRGEEKLAGDFGMALPGIQNLSRKKIVIVTSKSFGVVVLEERQGQRTERVHNLIVINDALPKSIERTYSTADDGQDGIEIICVENSSPVGPEDGSIEYNESDVIGRAQLMFTEPLKAGSPVKLRYSLANDGQLDVHGEDLTTNKKISTVFKTESLMTTEEIEEKKTRNMGITVS